MTAETWALLIAVVAEIVAGVLVAVESALSRTSRPRAQEMVDSGQRGAEGLLVITANPARYINAVLFVRIALTVLAVVIVADLIRVRMLQPGWAVAVTTVLMLVVNFVLLGVAPRTLGQQHFATIAAGSATSVRVLTAIVSPVSRLLILLGNAITPGKGFRSGPFASEAEIRAMVDQAGAESVLEPAEQRMLASVFELGDTLSRELMVPRTEMVFIEDTKRVRQALSLSLRSGFSRIPVIGDSLDDIIGVVHLKDIVSRTNDDPAAGEMPVTVVMRPALLMPDTKRADDLLAVFQATRTHLAVLVDEYGGTAGLVTVEDILEEIVGEIVDEYDADEIAECIELAPGDYRVSARMSIDELADLTGLDLTEDAEDVETVAGLLARRLGLVPIAGSTVVIADYTLTAETLEGRRNRISTIRVTKEPG